MAESRTPVYFQPTVDREPPWRVQWGLDYASLIELGIGVRGDTTYLLDAEILRFGLSVARNLDSRDFLLADAWIGGAYAGFMDGFLDWYHGLFGIRFPERDGRKHNEFAYRLTLPSGRSFSRSPSSLYLGDIRLGVGRRYNRHFQSLVSLTLPTATRPDGYGRGTVSLGVMNTVRDSLTDRVVFEGSANLGITPERGDLARYQRTVGFSASSGFRWRFWRGVSAFGNIYFATPYYHDTGIHGLDRDELSVDFGWIFRQKSGREWRLGMTEDLWPSGPAVDLVFRFGGIW
jgi:hypothetical protein